MWHHMSLYCIRVSSTWIFDHLVIFSVLNQVFTLALTLANENATLLTSAPSTQLAFFTAAPLTLSQFAYPATVWRCSQIYGLGCKQPGRLTLPCFAIESSQTYRTWAWDWSMSLRGRKIDGLMGKWLWLPTLFPHFARSIRLRAPLPTAAACISANPPLKVICTHL